MIIYSRQYGDHFVLKLWITSNSFYFTLFYFSVSRTHTHTHNGVCACYVLLPGLCRQERCGIQGVWERASDAQALLCSSLSLGQLGKGVDREEKVSLA